MTAFFALRYSDRLQARTLLSTRSFRESILFVHLKALRGYTWKARDKSREANKPEKKNTSRNLRDFQVQK